MASFISQFRGLISTPSVLPPQQVEKRDSEATSEKKDLGEGEEKIVYRSQDHESGNMKQGDRVTSINGRRGSQHKPPSEAKSTFSSSLPADSLNDKIHDGKKVPGNAHPSEKDQHYLDGRHKSKEALLEDNRRLNERISGMVRTYSNSTLDLQKAEGRIKELETANRQNLETLQAMENRYSQQQRLLDQRTLELREAKTYMKQPDEYPGSTILKKVESINSEIFNSATTINDLFEGSEKANWDETDVQKPSLDRCRQVAKQAIGELLYSVNCQIDEAIFMRDAIVPEESMPLQLALQCVLINWATKVVGAAGSFPGDDGGLKKVYEVVRSREEKSISSQWRVIAYGATKHREESSVDNIVWEVMSVLCIAGLATKSANYLQAEEEVHRRMKKVEKMLLNLKGAIHEGITSSDMEVVTLDTEADYDPHTMVDRYSVGTKSNTPRASSTERVLCTVGLGLRKTTMKRVAEKEFQEESELVKLPEVALATILEDFKLPSDDNFDEYLYVQANDSGI